MLKKYPTFVDQVDARIARAGRKKLAGVVAGTTPMVLVSTAPAIVDVVPTPAATDETVAQILEIVQPGGHIYAASATGTDAYAVTLDPAPAALTVGMVLQFRADVGNSGEATLAVNGLGAAAILKQHDTALATGEIEAGQIATVVWDGAAWQMQSQVATVPAGGSFDVDTILVDDTGLILVSDAGNVLVAG